MSRSKLFFLIVFILMSCGKIEETPTAKTYTVETINGVRYVHNQALLWGDDPRISLELSMILGDDETKGFYYFFSTPWDVNKDNKGNIYILDRREYHVQKYDPQGNYLQKFGRKGQGPSEISGTPNFFCLDTKGNLYIDMGDLVYYDLRIVVINPEGKEIKRFKLDKRENTFPLTFKSHEVLLNESNQIIQHINVPTKGYRSSENENMLIGGFVPDWFSKDYIRIYDNNGRFIREFEIEPFEIHVENKFARGRINEIFCAIDKESNIYVTFEHQNRIDKYSPEGELLMKIDREKGFEQTKKFKKDQKKLNVFSTGIGTDSKNRIWVSSFSRVLTDDEFSYKKEITGIFQFEVFDSDGILLCLIPWENNISGYYYEGLEGFVKRIYDDKLYIVDRWINAVVYEYKIVEK